jgi:hypothetical protein
VFRYFAFLKNLIAQSFARRGAIYPIV